MLKKIFLFFSLLSLPLSFATTTFAAAPDGAGPWADSTVTFTQGLRNDGSAVPAARSDPTSPLGIAEGTNVEGTFFSLGFGGTLTLAFVNGIAGGAVVVESTNLPYGVETANVEFSENGTTWVSAGSVSRTGTVSQPEQVACAKFVRITDTTNKAGFEPTADAYDVDGVQAQGQSCTPTTPPPCTGGNCGDCNITQTNTTTNTTSITQTARTGNNRANNNTGGGPINITTGNATNSATVTNGGNTNTSTGCCGCCNGGTSINVSNNGAGSTNTVVVTKGNTPNTVSTQSLVRRTTTIRH